MGHLFVEGARGYGAISGGDDALLTVPTYARVSHRALLTDVVYRPLRQSVGTYPPHRSIRTKILSVVGLLAVAAAGLVSWPSRRCPR